MLIFDLTLATRRPALTGVERFGVHLFDAVRRVRPDAMALVNSTRAFEDHSGLVAVPQAYRGWFTAPQIVRDLCARPEAVVFPSAPASPLFRTTTMPLCRIVHDVFPWSWERAMPWKGRLVYRYGENLMARRYDWLLGTTPAVAQDLRALFRRPDVDWCGNGPGVARDGPERRPDNVPDAFVLAVGTVEPRKGYARLVDLVDAAPAGAPPVVLVGRPGWGDVVSRVESLAARRPDRFVWLRDLPDEGLRWLYRRAACFLSLSLAEGFNMPLVESASCGRPVLCTDIPVHRTVAPPWARFVDAQEGPDALWADLRAPTSPTPTDSALYGERHSWEHVAGRLLEIIARRNHGKGIAAC